MGRWMLGNLLLGAGLVGCYHAPPVSPTPDTAEIRRLRSENLNLSDQVAAERARSAALEAELARCGGRGELAARLDQCQSRLRNMERRPSVREYDAALARVAQLERQLATPPPPSDDLRRARRRVAELERQLAQAPSPRDVERARTRMATLEQQLNRALGDLEAARLREAQLQRDLDRRQRSRGELDRLRASLDAAVAERERALVDLERARARIAALEDQRTRGRQPRGGNSGTVSDLRRQVSDLQGELNAANDRIRELERQSGRQGGRDQELADAQARVAELEARLADLPNREEIARMRKRFEQMKRRLEEARTRIKELEAELDD